MDKPARFVAGTQFSYSQIGYELLAEIVEKTSEKSFIELSDELFKECGMYHTFHPDLKEYKNLVKGYIENDEGKLEYTNETFSKYPTGKAFVGLEAYPAAGMFVSTAGDLALWSNILFGGKLLKESTLQLMTTKQDKAIKKSPVFGLAEYGYGVIANNEDDILIWAQTGYSSGFVSLTAYFPKSKTNVIVLENVNYDVDNTKKTFYYHTQYWILYGMIFTHNQILKQIIIICCICLRIMLNKSMYYKKLHAKRNFYAYVDSVIYPKTLYQN